MGMRRAVRACVRAGVCVCVDMCGVGVAHGD